MGYLMGIDLGSTSIKAVIYDYNGNHVSAGSRPTPLSHLDPEQPLWAVWEPDKIWDCVVQAVKEALRNVENPDEVGAVAVTGFGMDGLPLDKNGNPLYPMISWHCPRTIPQSREFSEKVGAKKIFDLTGKQIMAIDSIYRMIWMKENHPEILEKTDKWLLIEDFINFKLCGEKATDYSMAACTSVFSQKNHTWVKELIDAAGVPISIFPQAYQSGRFLGKILPEVAEATGLSPETKIILGGHDYVCGALAVGAVNDDVLLDLTGTWEMLVQASQNAEVSQACFESGYYIEGHVAEGRCLYVGSTVSGDMTEWLKNQLSADERIAAEKDGDSIWQHIMKTVEESPIGARGCFFLPHFSGAGAPRVDDNSMGAFLGLQNAVSRADMMRAVFEGLNYQFRMMVDSFRKYKLGNPKRIIATGGATRNTFWMQNKADVSGLELEVPDVYEATPLGAAMLAGIGSGVYKDFEEAVAAVHKPSVIYTPNKEAVEQYDVLYNEIYCKMQDELAGINAKIAAKFK